MVAVLQSEFGELLVLQLQEQMERRETRPRRIVVTERQYKALCDYLFFSDIRAGKAPGRPKISGVPVVVENG